MTKDKDVVADKNDENDFMEKEKIPYLLPNNDQLLSYWHYQLNVQHPPDLWKACHTYVDPEDKKAKLLARKRQAEPNLITELRGQSAACSFSKSRYVRDMRLLTIGRLLVGQKRDACIQLDQKLDMENNKYLQAKRDYKECVSALEQFLALDHEESMRKLGEAEAEMALTRELSDRRDELSRRYGQVRLEVYHWEEEWRTARACQRFLYRVSPLALHRELDADEDEHEHEYEEEDTASETECLIAVLSPRKDRVPMSSASDYGQSNSLDSLIAAFEKEASVLSKSPCKTPSDLGLFETGDLLRIFRTMELQNLNALIHLESLGGPMADMIARIDVAEVRVRRDIDQVLENIKRVEAAIEREERRAERLEVRSMVLVQRCFRALICSEQALQARVLVEDAYESCVGPNEAGLDALGMARGLESAYERLSAELDKLPRHLVSACEREGFRQEMRESREAEDAARKFELMRRLLAALRRIMEPLGPKRRMLMRRSVPMSRSKFRSRKDTDSISPSHRDAQNLDLFGKTCKSRNTVEPSDDDNDDEN